MSQQPYSFPGLRPFIERAASKAKLDDPALLARASTGPNVDAVALALSQVVDQARRQLKGNVSADTVGQVFARAEAALKVLAVQRAAVEAAIAEVKAAIDDGSYIVPPEPPRPRVEPVRVVKPPLPLAPPIKRVESNPPEGEPRASSVPAEPSKPNRRSRAVAKDKPIDKPDGPAPEPPTDETGRILDDIDGDGDVEPVIYPGVGEPTGPPAKTQDVDRKADDDDKIGKRHDASK